MKKPKQFKPKRASGAKKFQPRSNKPTTHQRGYDKDWTRYRFRFLHYNPTCYVCGQKATVVDHIERARDNPEKFDDLKNHCPLCASCHSTITGLFDAGKVQKLEGKLRYMRDMRQRNNIKKPIKVMDFYSKSRGI